MVFWSERVYETEFNSFQLSRLQSLQRPVLFKTQSVLVSLRFTTLWIKCNESVMNWFISENNRSGMAEKRISQRHHSALNRKQVRNSDQARNAFCFVVNTLHRTILGYGFFSHDFFFLAFSPLNYSGIRLCLFARLRFSIKMEHTCIT